jgi:hypothetical protein
MNKNNLLRFTLLILLFTLVASDVLFAQCAMCKAVAESEQEAGTMQMSNGLNAGILYLMSIPYIMVAIAGVWFYRRYKKQKIAQLAQL